MKGDDKIKNITIKFLGTGLLDNYQAFVKIYDNDNIYYCGNTFNGEIKIKLQENKAYKILAIFRNGVINTSFYVTCQNTYIFYFNNIIQIPKRMITFLLKDFNYEIPIMKGEIILGKNNQYYKWYWNW